MGIDDTRCTNTPPNITIKEVWSSMSNDKLSAELRRGGFCVQRYNSEHRMVSLSACSGSCIKCISDFLNKEYRKE